MTDELIPLESVPEVEPAKFNVSEEVQKAVDAALSAITHRSYSERHPELGRMFKCQVCKLRHRGTPCEQVFTSRIGDYEYYREDEKGELVLDFRTAVRPDEPPTKRQIIGAAAFKGKRLKPPLNKRANEFVQLVYSLIPDEYTKEELQKARKRAARILVKKYGRFNILPRKSAPQPKKEGEAS
jgi:hypothetical protein